MGIQASAPRCAGNFSAAQRPAASRFVYRAGCADRTFGSSGGWNFRASLATNPCKGWNLRRCIEGFLAQTDGRWRGRSRTSGPRSRFNAPLATSAEIPGTALNATAAELSPPAPTARPARGAHKKGLAGPVSSATAKNPASTESQASPLGGHQQDESGAVVPPAPSEADQLAELDPQADQLSGRETAISASLDTLQRQQNAHGLQLRSDIVAAQSRMRTYLLKRKWRFRLETFEMPANIWNWQNPKLRRSKSFWGAKQARQSE